MEEQACLVRARSDSESSSKLGSFGSISNTMTYTETRLSGPLQNNDGAGEPGNNPNMGAVPTENSEGNESGELLDYNDASVLEQFHEDALQQAGCGWSQVRIIFSIGLAFIGASLELSSIAFILPSAEIELCILPHEKNWLVLISVVGWSLGAVGWGALAERGGRRRALHAALAVNAVFAPVAAFMPTYGTFMMARFCSAIGSGGIIPAGYTYCAELTPRAIRTPVLGALPACLSVGAILSALLAMVALPENGEQALVENKEHFSAWHRYLLLCTIPILASLISLIWMPESPRYLIDVGREVDAMVVYQAIHRGNQSRVCGTGREYRPSDLALPAKRRAPALHHVRHSLKMFWQTFFQIFSSAYRNTTLSLAGMLLFVVGIQFYLSSYVPATIDRIKNEQYDLSKKIVQNTTFENLHYNNTIENIDYVDVTFKNCTFRDILMSHVQFVNCSFINTALSNIKSSYTAFKGVTFVNSTVIDTDLELGREFDSECVLNASIVRGMTRGCPRRADLRWSLHALLLRRVAHAHAALLSAPVAAYPRVHQRPVHAFVCFCCVVIAPLAYIQDEVALYTVESLYAFFTTLLFFGAGVKVVDMYPANLRCTSHGLILSITYMGGAAIRGMGAFGPLSSVLLCAVFAICAMAFAARVR